MTKHSSDGLYLEDQSHIEVRDLEIVNAPDGYDGSDSTVQRNLRDDRRGIHVVATVGSTEKNIQGVYLHDLYVHDVTDDAMSATKWDSSKRSGGIVFETILKDETTGLPMNVSYLENTLSKGCVAGLARYGGIGCGVDFNVFGNLAELVGKLEADADIAVFVNLDVVDQLNEDFTGQAVDILKLHKCHQRRVFLVNAVCQLRPFSGQPHQNIREPLGLLFVVGLHGAVFLLGDFPVFPVLIKRLLVAGDFRQFALLGVNQIVQSERLAFFDWSRIDTSHQLRVGNRQMHLLLNGKQDGSLQTVVLERVHGAGQPGTVFISGTSVVDIFSALAPGDGLAAVGTP